MRGKKGKKEGTSQVRLAWRLETTRMVGSPALRDVISINATRRVGSCAAGQGFYFGFCLLKLCSKNRYRVGCGWDERNNLIKSSRSGAQTSGLIHSSITITSFGGNGGDGGQSLGTMIDEARSR